MNIQRQQVPAKLWCLQHRKAMSNTTHDSDDAAIVSMEINTLMNWTQISVVC